MTTLTTFSAQTLQNCLVPIYRQLHSNHIAIKLCAEKRTALIGQTSECGRYQNEGFSLDAEKIGNIVHRARNALQDTKSALAQAKALGERLSEILNKPDTIEAIRNCEDSVEMANTITDGALIKVDESAHKSLTAIKLLFLDVKVARDALEQEIHSTEASIVALQKVGHYAKYGSLSGMITSYDKAESELKELKTELPENVEKAIQALLPEIQE